MTSEAGRQVLELLASGRIRPDEAERLLRALGDVAAPESPPPPPLPPPPDAPASGAATLGGRTLRIQVLSGSESRVNIALPLGMARLGKANVALGGLVKGHLAKLGLDLDELLRGVSGPGPVVDVRDGEERVLIVVE